MGKHETGIDSEYRSAIGRLASRHRLDVIRGAVAVLLAAAVAALSVIYMLHGLFGGWPPLPLLSFCLFWMVMLAALYKVVRRQLPRLRSGGGVAGDIDRARGLKGLLSSAFEFSGGEGRLERYSPFLRDETVRRALEEIRGMDRARVFPGAGRPAWGTAGLLTALLLLAQVSFMVGRERSILAVVTDPGIYFRDRGGVNLLVTSGNMTVLSGGDATCEAVDFGGRAGEVSLHTSMVPGVWRETGLMIDTVRTDGVDMALYRHRFENVRESFGYAFVSGAGRSGERTVTVIHRPVINSLSARITPPLYTGSPVMAVPGIAGRIYAPTGSRLELTGETSKEISRGEIWFSSGEKLPLEPIPGGFAVSFATLTDDTFLVEVVDTMGLESERQIRYPITVLEDQHPGIEILAPEDGAHLPLAMQIDLVYRASDDYGVSRLVLHAMRSGKDERFRAVELPMPPGGSRREIEGAERWELSEMRLFPGDEVLYFLEVYDNNKASGPSVGRTETRKIRVPSLTDIYERIRDEDRARREDLTDALEESGDVRMRLRELSDELKARGEFEWSRRRESQELLAKQEELTGKIHRAAEQLDGTLETLERNSATTQEIGERLAEIRELLSQIESDELRTALERFRKALDDVDSDELAEAMRRVDVNLEEFARRLDRAAELLKQVMREEKLEEFVRRTEEMLEKQGDVKDSEADTGELADRQESLAREMQAFERDMEALAGEEAGSPFSEGLEETLGEIESAAIGRSMMDAASMLSGGDKSGARSSQSEAMDGLLSLYTSLSRFQFGIGLAMDAEALEEISRSAARLIEISKEQERWVLDVIGLGGPDLRAELIKNQIILRDAMTSVRGRLYLVARKTMAVPGTVFYHIERALAAAEGVLEEAGERRGPEAADRAREAYERLNLAAIELLKSSGSTGSCGGQGDAVGMQRIMGEQYSLDRQLREMLGGGSAGQWSIDERAGMERLAAEQRRLEELLEQTLEESRGAGEILGRLDDLGDEMLEIAERLERGELDDRLLEREERILSRMLESQRSIAQRDYRRERISRTAGDVGAAPGPGPVAHESDTEMLLEMIRRSMRERGPAEYEELNRFYFRALSRKVRAKER
jgi:hypothetical protein